MSEVAEPGLVNISHIRSYSGQEMASNPKGNPEKAGKQPNMTEFSCLPGSGAPGRNWDP